MTIKKKLPKYVNAEVARGKRIFYYRRDRGRRIRLPNEFGTKEFFDAVSAAESFVDANFPKKEKIHNPTREQISKLKIGAAIMLMDWGTDVFDAVFRGYRNTNRTKTLSKFNEHILSQALTLKKSQQYHYLTSAKNTIGAAERCYKTQLFQYDMPFVRAKWPH